MKINEIIVNKDRQQLDEIAGRAIASGIGAVAGGLLGGLPGAALGAAGGAWLGQKLKNVFEPDDPMQVNMNKITQVITNEILADYKTFLKQRGTLTPEQVKNWTNQKFRNTFIPGTNDVPYTFDTEPASSDFRTVEAWVRKSMIDAETKAMTQGTQKPNEPISVAPVTPPVPANGSALNTNKGKYEVKRGQWYDPAGKPVSTEISDRLSTLYAEQNKIVGTAPYPNKSVQINTSAGAFAYTDSLGRGWNWYKVPVTSSTQPPITDPATVQRLNEIAKEQATP